MIPALIPAPHALTVHDGSFELTADTAVSGPECHATRFLTALLRRATGYAPPPSPEGAIVLSLDGPADLGEEGYRLDVSAGAVRLRARTEEGLFRGVQTLRQLLPAGIESPVPVPGPWPVPCVSITDKPRFRWRGVMLDVARHFFDVAAVKRFVDRAVPYKFNVLHLHLTDDQGWRLEIASHPRLTGHGGTSQVGEGPGGHFSRADFAEIVAYAAAHHMTVVPEIDLPGHTQAAMASYPHLAPEGVTPELYRGIDVGFSQLAVHKPTTYDFLDEVFTEVASLAPGPYLHVGGDEALQTTAEDYAAFMTRTLPLATRQGKTVVAWQEAAAAPALPEGTHLQYWRPTHEPVPAPLADAASRGVPLIMSPANRAYLDMKYDETSELGLIWAGALGVRQSYEWDPEAVVPGARVAGVEAPLWSETLTTSDDIDHMLYPRLPGLAEVAWSPAPKDWSSYVPRLRAHTLRWDAAGITSYHRSPELGEG
ncbi:beta-N-acetylhexosaminidase [Actinocorallia populi]|uniref:beta-N-acetylhexosaminidase n=1 Tax=Actinocorallia populi TaxID=2079200 RepID=UPI000D097EB5|nr:beta-N-acetylhexosaminidase [Actinocorallia populi]